MIANYHTHTVRCRHAKGTERDYIERAIAAGIKTLGFSDHSPYLFEGDYYSSFRMFPDQASEYAATLRSLREEYRDQIRILVGYEAEYYPKYFSRLQKFLEDIGYDYLILGQHVLGNEIGGFYSAGGTDDPALLKQYTDQVMEGLSTGKFLYLAHPDMFKFDGDPSVYEKETARLCEFCKTRDIPLEVNLLGIIGKRHYPTDRFFDIAAEVGCKTILGIDAHDPAMIGNTEAEKIGYSLATKPGLTLVETLI